MKRYPEYKSSGVPWLGDIPAHWESRQVRFLMTCNDDVLSEDTDGDFLVEYVEISDVDEREGITSSEIMPFSSAPSRARRKVMNGDILVSTVRTYLRAVAAVSEPPENMIASTGFAVLRPVDIDSAYAKYAVLFDGFISEVIARSKGISYPAINATDLVRISIPVPSLPEQKAIAVYLDTETARIDTLVQEKEDLIGLLKEWRQSVIAQAVTKGLNKDAPMKASGVDWLGDIPAHWEGKRLRDCVEGCLNGVWGDDPDGGVDDIPVIRVADFDRPKRQVVEYETVRKVEKAHRSGRTLSTGDMLIEKSGGGEQQPVGMVVSYLGPDGAVCSNFVARMTPREGVFSRFMVYLHAHYYAAKVAYISIKQTTGIQNLDSMAYLSEACFIPPLPEQKAIAEYLDAETTRIDALIAHTTEEIDLLKELRAVTIADAVLGRIDVRETTHA